MRASRLQFTHFPAFARYILNNRLEAYVQQQLEVARREKIPLLKFFAHLNDEQLLEFGTVTAKEFLSAFESNNMEAFIEHSVHNWVNNQLPMLSREQVIAEDITSISLMRRKTLRHFLRDYTTDPALTDALLDELDGYIAETETRSFNTYLMLQHEAMQQMNESLRASNADLAETQLIARLGSYEWYMGREASKMSDTMRELFSLEGGSTIDDYMQCVHPDDRSKIKKALDDAFADPHGHYECEYRFIKNGVEKVLLSRGVVTFNNSEPVKLKGTVMDVTDRHLMVNKLQASEAKMLELNRYLEQKNTELQKKNKELETLNFAVSHDLQEPLRKIQVFSSMLRNNREPDIETIRANVEKIHFAATRLRQLINDLFTFSLLDSSSDESSRQTDLNETLRDVISDYQLLIAEKDVQVTADPLPTIAVRPSLAYQLLQNLLSNSIKYAADNRPPEVHISYKLVKCSAIPDRKCGSPDDMYHAISITDNGIGIDEKYHDTIFRLFQRLHNRRDYSGTGIGLAMCLKIMDFYHGFITVSSKLGVGSTFTAYFPAS